MAMIWCHKCGTFFDNDESPCVEHNGNLICQHCADHLEIDDDFAAAVEKQVREKGSVSRKTLWEGK